MHTHTHHEETNLFSVSSTATLKNWTHIYAHNLKIAGSLRVLPKVNIHKEHQHDFLVVMLQQSSVDGWE